ncbi:MAG: caspase family protein, partial [Paramuribaculum sp.]|nr:caspase family protein [Paramuribaculum sp.]
DINGDEHDKWDEAILPVDAPLAGKKGVYEGERHLTDDKLVSFVSAIRRKVGPKGVVYVVLDACFSGDSSRGDDEFIRGSQKAFTRNGYVVIKPKNRANRKVRTFARLDCPSGYSHVTYLEACQSDEVNTEIIDASKRKHYGPLSLHIATYLSTHKMDAAGAWVKAIRTQMKQDSRVMYQNMKIESSIIK